MTKKTSTIVRADELKIRGKIEDIIDNLINELKSISAETDQNSKEPLTRIFMINDELETKINKSIKRAIFNFTKLPLAKDLRRNVAYFQILLGIKRISRFAAESANKIIDLKKESDLNFGNDIGNKENILGLNNGLIFLLKELKVLLTTESLSAAKKMAKETDLLVDEYRKSILNDNFLSKDLANLNTQEKSLVFYNYIFIVRNFELISGEIKNIAKLIIYIETGKLNSKN